VKEPEAGQRAERAADRGEEHLHEIFVAPDFQRRSIGSLLMALAKELAPAGRRLHTLQHNSLACRSAKPT